jgi:Icc protein
MMVNNGTAVIRLLAKYNVKIVLQGHVHIVEELRYKNTTYITGGSLSNARKDPNFEHPDGFVVVDVKGDEFRWKYAAYPWTSKE